MLRMLLAVGLVYLLLPNSDELQPAKDEGTQVSTMQTLGAMDAIVRDLGEICERNEEACETGKALIQAAKTKVQAGLEQISAKEASGNGAESRESDTAIGGAEPTPVQQ